MGRSLIVRLLAALMFMLGTLVSGASLYAQTLPDTDPVDSALDRYAAICNRCLDLKELAAAGNEIPADEFQALVKELAALKTMLQGGSGKMTDAQRSRFIAIRESYAAGRHYDNSDYQAAAQPDNAAEVPDSTSKQQPISLPITSSSASTADIIEKHTIPSLRDYGISLTLMTSMGAWPELNYGLMGVVERGRWGVFLRGRSDFQYMHPDYSCIASDGSTSYGYIWTSGKNTGTLTAITAGGVYNLFDIISIYAGAGYGHRNLFWEDTAGKWALVSDLSGACIAADAGILFHFGPVTAGIGVNSFALSLVNMEFALGWRF